jgi:hypothetical protein
MATKGFDFKHSKAKLSVEDPNALASNVEQYPSNNC